MIDFSQDVDSLSNFKRQTAEFVQRIKKTGRPVVLTINGKAALVVQDAAAYQQMAALADKVEGLEILRKSIEDADAGRTRPMRAVVKNLGKRS